MSYLKAIVLLSALIVFDVRSIIVKISTGKLHGYQTMSDSGKLVNIFKQIPYAAPPVGHLRFQKPRPPDKWEGIREASEYGPACMSNSSTTTSPQKWIDEDCLHLNIFAGADCLKNTVCPVVFYIHGGGFNYDSAVMFNDDYLVNNFAGHDIVLVIPGIRLGFFGLLTFNNENVVPSNIAAYDLIAALMFVQNEIEHFGGDHNHVTLFGHSQGATTVAQFIFSKKIDPDKKLFQKGVMMSMSFYFANKSRMQDISMEFAFRSKCSPSRRVQNISEDFTKNVVNCLQKIDSFELLRIQRQMEDEDMNLSPEGLVMTRPLFGSIDNLTSFLQKPTPRPLLIGTTSREFDSKPPRDHVEEYIVEFLGIKNKHDVLRQYHKDELLKKLPFNHTTETQHSFLSTYIVGHEMRKSGGKVYLYSYRNPHHPFHTDDLYYIMGVHPFKCDRNENLLAKIYPRYFINFIKTGKPQRDWSPLQAKLDNYMYIDVNIYNHSLPHMTSHYEHDVIDYWKKLKRFDQLLYRENPTMAKRATNTSTIRNTSSADVLIVFLPSLAVLATVVYVRYVVGRHQQSRQQQQQEKQQQQSSSVSDNGEQTPLIYWT